LTVRIVALVAVLLTAAAIGAAVRRRDRRITVVADGDIVTAADLHDPNRPGPDDAGSAPASLGAKATFLQFSTPVCAGCKPAARVLDGLVAQEPGLRRIEIDATRRPDLAQRLDILSTPTVIVLDPAGRVISRLTGVPTPQQALAAAGLPERARNGTT
jgi:thiol-disulfide isomerase/thioredoxin